MSREDIARLLGGYATGTLTPEEKQALFAAALEDQALFDELGREQALREVLREPAARGQLLAALQERPRWFRQFGHWMMRPGALTAATACLLVLGAVAIWRPWQRTTGRRPAMVATALPAETPSLPAPAAAESKLAPAEPGTPARSLPVPAIRLPIAPALKKNRPAVELAPPPAANRSAEEPGAAAPPPGSPAPQAAPQPAGPQVMTDSALARRDTAELKSVPDTGTAAAFQTQGASTGGAAARGAFPANEPKPASVTAVTAADARQLYYAGATPPAGTSEVESKRLHGAAKALAGAPAALGLRWTVLRRGPTGEFSAAAADGLLAGDTVALRLAPNQACDLSVFEDAAGTLTPLFARRLRAGETVETPPLTPHSRGTRALVISVVRAGSAMGAIATLQSPAQSQNQQSSADPDEGATYTVGPAGAQRISLSVTLNYQ